MKNKVILILSLSYLMYTQRRQPGSNRSRCRESPVSIPLGHRGPWNHELNKPKIQCTVYLGHPTQSRCVQLRFSNWEKRKSTADSENRYCWGNNKIKNLLKIFLVWDFFVRTLIKIEKKITYTIYITLWLSHQKREKWGIRVKKKEENVIRQLNKNSVL